MKQITDNVYVETGFRGANCSFVTTAEGIVMIESPQMPEEAVKWRDEIAKHGIVKYLINTEPHGDHFSGNCFFDGTVVGHEGTRQAILASNAEQFKERMKQMSPASLPFMDDFIFCAPTITLSERLTLCLGEHTFRLIHLPGHSPYQVAVYVPEEKVVFTSDNIVRAQPFLHQALPYEWLESLKKYQELDADFLVPGHGDVCDKSYIPEMSAAIQNWINAVEDAKKQGLTLEQAQSNTALLEKHGIKVGVDQRSQMSLRNSLAHLWEVVGR
ncbi:MAG: MBL fold metallo-hydrolase [Chloroflexi bacterium]|nr:MBL fold metallo-hydrolase [Chloroflexota bacterium]